MVTITDETLQAASGAYAISGAPARLKIARSRSSEEERKRHGNNT
jgi:hypothetical protein